VNNYRQWSAMRSITYTLDSFPMHKRAISVKWPRITSTTPVRMRRKRDIRGIRSESRQERAVGRGYGGNT
jgi:hypothetical protein